LLEATKLGSKAAKVGFDWPDTAGILDKLHEEVAELEAEVISSQSVISRKEEELGDLLFTIANLARHLKIDPELALRRANAKFRRRFAAMESYSDASLESLTAVELETLWNSVKAGERGQR
jgi:uncharacterized protein YabN with tetrapyrrole methylase and pyrophosphatase domain